jgi:hypothetical protein
MNEAMGYPLQEQEISDQNVFHVVAVVVFVN